MEAQKSMSWNDWRILSNQNTTSEWIWPHCVSSWHTTYSILLWTMMMIKMGLETTLWIVLCFAGLSPASLLTIWPSGQQPNKPKRYLATQIGNKDKDNSLEDSYPDVAMAPRVVSFCTMKPNSFWSHIWDFTKYFRILHYQTMKGNLRILSHCSRMNL